MLETDWVFHLAAPRKPPKRSWRRSALIGMTLGAGVSLWSSDAWLEQQSLALQSTYPVWRLEAAERQAMQAWQTSMPLLQTRAKAPDWRAWRLLALSLQKMPALYIQRLHWSMDEEGHYRFDLEGDLRAEGLVPGLRLWDTALAQWEQDGWQRLVRVTPFQDNRGRVVAGQPLRPEFALRLWHEDM